MAAEGGQPAGAAAGAAVADPAAKNDQKPQGQQAESQAKAPQAAAQGASPAGAGEKQLSNAELKKKRQEEKAARRAQAKMAQVAQPTAGPSAATPSTDGAKAGGKAKANPKQGGLPVPGVHHHRAPSRGALPPMVKEVAKPKIPECFSHLSMAKRIPMTQADKDVNPVVLALGQQMSSFAISDSTSRLETTLLAFKKVIDAYTTPHGNTFSRHFTSHVLNPQIEYLTACRPMCFSMGNAIRWLKLQIAKIDIDLPDAAAKATLCHAIDNFLHERIVLADYVIVNAAAERIANHDVILTYAHHKLVERALVRAKQDCKKHFRVILVDDPFDRVGIDHAKRLAEAGIPVTYVSDLAALRTHLQEATMMLAGAEAMFSNGSMYARAGTCDIATVATDLDVRVVVLSETVNFTERMSIDSLTYNEIDPERSTDEDFRLLFDTTRAKFISVLVTELGNLSAMAVLAILRKIEVL